MAVIQSVQVCSLITNVDGSIANAVLTPVAGCVVGEFPINWSASMIILLRRTSPKEIKGNMWVDMRSVGRKSMPQRLIEYEISFEKGRFYTHFSNVKAVLSETGVYSIDTNVFTDESMTKHEYFLEVKSENGQMLDVY